MRRLLYFAVAGVWLASVSGAFAADKAKASKPVKPAPVKPVKEEPSCSGDYGTNVEFEETPTAAATKAAKEQKLVMVLHVSGHFEDPALT